MTKRSKLEAFPRPGVAVDLAIFTVARATDSGPELRLLVQDRERPTGRALPGAFMRERCTVAETVDDVLRRKLGINPPTEIRPRLLRLFDDPARDDRTWSVSAAHSVSVREHELTDAKGDLVPLTSSGRLTDEGPLLFDHDEIVTEAVAALRERYEIRYRYVDVRPDPDRFLPEPFTLLQLRKVHEAVVGSELHKDNFARRMKPYLRPVTRRGEVVLATNQRGRPAALFRSVARD